MLNGCAGKHKPHNVCDKKGWNCRMMQLRRAVNEIGKLLGCGKREKKK